MNPFIVSCDPSSKKLAYVAKHPLTPTVAVKAYSIRRKTTGPYTAQVSADAMYVCHEFLDQITPMAGHNNPRLLFIEAPAVGRGGARTSLVQAYVSGVVQACFVQAGFTVELVQNTTWKRVVCGNGGATKDLVRRSLASLWPSVAKACGTDQDLTDAACINLYGQRKTAAG